MQETIAECEALVGYNFQDRELFIASLTHSSAKSNTCEGNERLEFFGDAILGMIISEYLFNRFPDFQEGELTRIKSAVVSRQTLANRTQTLGLSAYMKLGKGLAMKAKIPPSVLANIYEAVVAAIYIDGGYEAGKSFVLRTLKPVINDVLIDRHQRNYKSLLQQIAQRRLGVTPQYRVVSETGPDHGKTFEVVAVLGERRYGTASGRSKKDAEQRAAALALQGLANDHPDDKVLSGLFDSD